MKQRLTGLLAMIMLSTVLLIGCGDRSALGCSASIEEDASKKIELELGTPQWASAIANSYLIKNILEENFDVNVNIKDIDGRAVWKSLATGDTDFIASAWLPCDDNYINEVSDQVVNLGPLYDQAKVGLVVPTYVEINSIDELNANADKFGGKIVGIQPGACDMYRAISAIDQYNMTDMQLVPGSEKTMIEALENAYKNGEWIVVTGWEPHLKSKKMDLKFLEDPKNVYGKTQTINLFTKLGFEEDYPEINKFLDNYALNEDQFYSLLNIMEEYDDPNEAAKIWIETNRELVDSWLE